MRPFGWFRDLQGNLSFRRGFPELRLMRSLKPPECAYLRKAFSGQHICLQWQVWMALMQAQFSFPIKQREYSERHSEPCVVELLKEVYFATHNTPLTAHSGRGPCNSANTMYLKQAWCRRPTALLLSVPEAKLQMG